MLLGSPSSSVSSYSRSRRLGGAAVMGVKPPVPVSQVDALNRLWQVANSEQHTGENKTARIVAMMERAAVRPRAKREGKGPGWWSNEYPDLIFS